MTSHGIRRIERLNYMLGGVAIIVATLVVPTKAAYSLAIGVALTCLNFAALRWLVFRWTSAVKANDPTGSNRIILILPKMILMMGAVTLVMLFLPIDAIAFLIGFSVFLPSIVIAAVLDTVAPGPPDADATPAPAADPPPTTPPSETHG